MKNERVYNADGQLVRTVTYDLDAGTVTIEEDGSATVEPVDAGLLAALIAARDTDAPRQRLDQAAATLRQWAADAEATTATSSNAVQVLNVVVDRLGVFFDRFADLLDER